jgi:CXXC-20-CXXC protein
LYKICPHCGEKIKLKDCFSLLYENIVECKKCKKKSQVKRKTMFIHGAILGAIIAIMAKIFLNSSVIECGIYGFVFSVLFQRFIDFFYDLEPVMDQ